MRLVNLPMNYTQTIITGMNMDDVEDLPQPWIFAAFEQSGLTQTEIGHRIGESPQTINNWIVRIIYILNIGWGRGMEQELHRRLAERCISNARLSGIRTGAAIVAAIFFLLIMMVHAPWVTRQPPPETVASAHR